MMRVFIKLIETNEMRVQLYLNKTRLIHQDQLYTAAVTLRFTGGSGRLIG